MYLPILIYFFVMMSTPFLWAIESMDFEKSISEFSEKCTETICLEPFKKTLIFDLQLSSTLDPKVKVELEKISYEQAQIWGDTILEGDYEADGKTVLDRVYLLLKNDRPIGYEITYYEKAWRTDDCLYDGYNDSSLQGCDEGRIYESSYVSLDYKKYFYDLNMAAHFKKP